MPEYVFTIDLFEPPFKTTNIPRVEAYYLNEVGIKLYFHRVS